MTTARAGTGGVSSYSAIQDSQAHVKTARKLLDLGIAVVHMQRQQKGMEESLGRVILGLQRRITGLERELSTLAVREIDNVASGLFAGIKPNIAGAVRSADKLAAEVLNRIDLSSYAKSSNIRDLLSWRKIDRIASKLRAGTTLPITSSQPLATFRAPYLERL